MGTWEDVSWEQLGTQTRKSLSKNGAHKEESWVEGGRLYPSFRVERLQLATPELFNMWAPDSFIYFSQSFWAFIAYNQKHFE